MKEDIKKVNHIAKNNGITTDKERREFGDYIHKEKRSGRRGSKSNGDFSDDELDQLAKEFKRE
jgi:hypothetical protein